MPNSAKSPTPPTGGSSSPRYPHDPHGHPESGIDKKSTSATDAAKGAEGEDGHIGATEDQVSDRSAPSGAAFKDEPKQG